MPIEIRELQEEGYTKYQARIIAFGQTIVSDIVTSVAAAAAGVAALYFGAPTVVAIVATVGTQYAAGQLYEATGGKTFVTNSLVDFSQFVAKEIPGTLFDDFYNLDNKANISLSSEFAKVVNAYSEYLVIPTTKGGYSVALNEKDKAIFLNEKPIQTVSYWDVKGDKGVNVNLEDGTTEIMGSNAIKDFLGNAIQNVTGTKFDDKIIGNKVANELNGISGRDYIEGGGGDDIINVGMEKDILNNRKFWESDDIASGGKDKDTLIAIGKNNNVWYDDFEFNSSNLFGRVVKDVFARQLRSTSQINARPYVGDSLYGNGDADIFYLGMGDKVLDANSAEGDTIFIYKGGTNSVVKSTGGVFTRSHSPLIGAGFSPYWDLNNFGEIFVNPERFTDESKLVFFAPLGERGVKASLNFPGILQNKAGDEMLLRFPEGMVVINSDGTYSFITNAATKRVNNGDFGYQFPIFEGYEANTDSYVIGDGQWILDVQKEFIKIFGKEAGISNIGTIQGWLRNEVFPAVDPFRKALIGNNSVYYTYEYYGTDGTRYGLYYDEKGDENYDNYLGNRQKASTSSEQIMPLSAKNIDNTANTDAIKNSFQELNTYYNYNGSTNFWGTMIENIEPPNQVFNANTTKLI